MLPVVDKPAIQYVVEEAVRAGIDDILIITGRGKRSLEDHFDRNFELEYYLAAKGKTDELRRGRATSPSWPTSTTCARASRSASATPCRWPASTSATTRSSCCSATTSWTGARPCSPGMISTYEQYGRSVVALHGGPARGDRPPTAA